MFYILGAVIAYLLIVNMIQFKRNSNQVQIISKQNDTIQKLINREPVTYAETGTKPQNKPTERYSAWAGQMVDMNEEESRS